MITQKRGRSNYSKERAAVITTIESVRDHSKERAAVITHKSRKP
jgi:hypothetical protein